MSRVPGLARPARRRADPDGRALDERRAPRREEDDRSRTPPARADPRGTSGARRPRRPYAPAVAGRARPDPAAAVPWGDAGRRRGRLAAARARGHALGADAGHQRRTARGPRLRRRAAHHRAAPAHRGPAAAAAACRAGSPPPLTAILGFVVMGLVGWFVVWQVMENIDNLSDRDPGRHRRAASAGCSTARSMSPRSRSTTSPRTCARRSAPTPRRSPRRAWRASPSSSRCSPASCWRCSPRSSCSTTASASGSGR